MSDDLDRNRARSKPPRNSGETESLLRAVNRSLRTVELKHRNLLEAPRYPTLFIIGPPRSGTTLLSQLLISAFEIGYVNNLAARFWDAPYVGLSLAATFQDFSRRPAVDFDSDLGATVGYEGPHEFGNFWRRWFSFGATHKVGERQLARLDRAAFRREIAAMESVFNRPFLFKNLVCSFQLHFLAETLPLALFLDCRREPLYVLQSLLKARKSKPQPLENWFSVKPPEYERLAQKPPEEQIAGQVYFTVKEIERSLDDLDPARYLRIAYEDLVADPAEQLKRISARLESQGAPVIRRDFKVQPFRSADRRALPSDELIKLARAWESVQEEGADKP